MAHSQTKYSSEWEKEYKFLKASSSSVYKATCTYCSTEFKIDNQGLSQVKSHSKGKKHIQRLP